jgi:Cof subfamily protein (haloacid dehalogenase superfamily)
MDTMIKCIVFDLDHTLLNDDKVITPFTLKMITKLKEMGILVTLASGRAEPLMLPYVSALDITLPVIANNGALIKNFSTKEVLHEAMLNEEAQSEILQDAIDNNLAYIFYSDNIFYVNSEERVAFYKKWNQMYPEAFINIKITNDFDYLSQKKSYKLLLIIEDEVTFDHYYKKYINHPDAYVTRSQDTFLDVLPKNSNKGNAVRMLANHLNIGLDEILAFGDNDNDAKMLNSVGLSIAMPNGSKKAMESATFLAPFTNQEEGVAKALELLIKQGILQPVK